MLLPTDTFRCPINCRARTLPQARGLRRNYISFTVQLSRNVAGAWPATTEVVASVRIDGRADEARSPNRHPIYERRDPGTPENMPSAADSNGNAPPRSTIWSISRPIRISSSGATVRS